MARSEGMETMSDLRSQLVEIAHRFAAGDLRLGRWEDVLADVSADTVITDPPYGARTHNGARQGARADGFDVANLAPSYEHWTAADVSRFVASWAPRTRRWICAMTSHDLVTSWEKAYRTAGLYPFAPVPIVIQGMTCRLAGDGPSSWTIYLMVARSKSRTAMANPASNGTALWRTTRGAYVGPADTDSAGGGRGKPAWLLRAIVEDYSNPGDRVVDPMAGWGTTLIAGANAGRVVTGAEVDPDAHRTALERCHLIAPADSRQLDFFAEGS